MSTLQRIHPIIELRRFCAGAIRALRHQHHVDAELILDGARDIAEDITTERIKHDRSIADLIARAQSPYSPGGKNITPAEALPIVAVASKTVEALESEAQASVRPAQPVCQ